MNSDANRDVGWRRRYRQTDLGAALLFGAAAAATARLGWAGTVGLIVAGIILMIAYRERRLERVGREIWLAESWWFLRTLRVRRRAVQPGRVVLTLPESGWLARRRTLLSVDGHEGSILLERWRHESERIYATQIATDLARWFGVRTSGVLAPFDNRPDAPDRWAALRASLDTLKGVPGDGRGGAPLPYRLFGRRPALKAVQIWIVMVGVGLMCLSRLTYLARGVDVFALVAALPLGALMATYGLASALQGRIRAEILPSGLHVERLGLRPDVLLHIPFTSVSWLGAPTSALKRRKPALQIGCGDALATLTARKLGLKPAAFEKFCGAYRRALADWLDRQLGERTSGASQIGPPRPPTGPVELDDRRAAPNSVVTVFAQLAPRLSVVLVGAFIVALFLLARGPAHPVMRAPAAIQTEAPPFLAYLGLRALLSVAGFAVVAAALAIVLYLFLSAPQTRWTYALLIPVIVSPVLVLFGLLLGQELADCWNLCGGSAWAGKDLVDVDGIVGGRYQLRARDYHPTCDAWQAHLPARLRKER
ncbi:MAG TPA: hypothetical protein VMT03_00890 [Polyangia bacterium]|nr:hypothetical protein [Polyangia bacterium]